MRDNKKGFTLVELLITISLLAIVGGIIVYNMTNISRRTKEKEYDRYVSLVKSAASMYADLNPDIFSSLYDNKAFIYIKAEELISEGLIDDDIKNPYTKETIGEKETIKASLEPETGSITFEYPLSADINLNGTEGNTSDDETFLVAMSDYIVWGEPYNCMTGAGSYELALSDDDGNLIQLDNPSIIEKYHFECKLPPAFSKDVYDPDTSMLVGKQIDVEKNSKNVSGSYDVTYSWINELGKRKTAKRVLKVLPKVTPSFRTNYVYDLEKSPWFTPEFDSSTNEWKYLTFTPVIEGADHDTTLFKISKKGNNPKSDIISITEGFTNEYKEFKVDDGDKDYIIETVVEGRYYKKYSYTSRNQVTIKSKLVVPASLIGGSSTNWTSQKNFSINGDIYSPIGVNRYEYKLINDRSEINNKSEEITTNQFSNISGSLTKNINIFNIYETSSRELRQFKYIVFRAINNEGYIGDWSSLIDAYITNQGDLLIKTSSSTCTNCAECCKSDGTGGCYYCDKSSYINYGGILFNILEKTKDGKIIATIDGTSGNKVSLTTIEKGSWTIQTCEGTYTTSYNYSTPIRNVLMDKGNEFLATLPSNYKDYLSYKYWKAGYNAYVGTITNSEYNKYAAGLRCENPFWTASTFSKDFTIYNQGKYSTAYNTYYYAVENGSITDKYAGSTAYFKPIVEFKTIYIISGDGSITNPYVLA